MKHEYNSSQRNRSVNLPPVLMRVPHAVKNQDNYQFRFDNCKVSAIFAASQSGKFSEEAFSFILY
jgi:predicted metallo-beta-lactamase superfamily hydrolase